MAFLGFIAQIILIFLIVQAASNRPGSTAGQRWGIGIGVLVLTKAISFGMSFTILAALPAFGVIRDENNVDVVTVLIDIPLGIMVVIGGYFMAKAAYNLVCGPKTPRVSTQESDSHTAEV